MKSLVFLTNFIYEKVFFAEIYDKYLKRVLFDSNDNENINYNLLIKNGDNKIIDFKIEEHKNNIYKKNINEPSENNFMTNDNLIGEEMIYDHSDNNRKLKKIYFGNSKFCKYVKDKLKCLFNCKSKAINKQKLFIKNARSKLDIFNILMMLSEFDLFKNNYYCNGKIPINNEYNYENCFKTFSASFNTPSSILNRDLNKNKLSENEVSRENVFTYEYLKNYKKLEYTKKTQTKQ
jgi:hypothetical protein